jgi:hypothetical protein
MGKYITYPRTPDGNIEHEPDAIVMHSDASLDPDVHEEALTGWPERKGHGRATGGPVSVSHVELHAELAAPLIRLASHY